MSNLKIYYAPGIFNVNGKFIGDDILVRQSDVIEKSNVYMQCPVAFHKYNRTFIGYAPSDVEINIDKKERLIITTDGWENKITCEQEYFDSPNLTIQFYCPRYLFWTEEENVWLEFNDHPMTSYKNNCIAINGWFNLSNWPRCSNFAVTIVDVDKPIVIKKGDPLFRLTFHSNDLNKGIILTKETNNEIIDAAWKKSISNKDEMTEITKGKNHIPYLSSVLFSKTDKKCPFRFLFSE